MKTFHIKTFGCKVNYCESEIITGFLIKLGFVFSKKMDKSDIIVINTCAITNKALVQSKKKIKLLATSSPNSRLIITGCYTQIAPEEIVKIYGVDRVFLNKSKNMVIKKCYKIDIGNKLYYRGSKKDLNIKLFQRSRALTNIQNGCNSYCTYCIIPYSRGKIKSLEENQVLDNIYKLKIKNYKEVILTGIHLGSYGLDLYPKTNLCCLVEKILKNNLIDRLRLSSMDPLDLTEDILNLVLMNEDSKLCKHFHLSIQSGDDCILNRMNRPYNIQYVISLINKILKKIPESSIGFDVIVGFPGETEKSFNNTYNLLKFLKISYLHVFPFSYRKGTKAFGCFSEITDNKLKFMCEKIRNLGINKKQEFYKRFIGKTIDILVGTKNLLNFRLKGISDNYLPVNIFGPNYVCNTVQSVKVEKLDRDGILFGSIKNV